MTTRVRRAVMVAITAALVGGLAGAGSTWLAVGHQHRATPAAQPKTTSELLIGKWKWVKCSIDLPAGYRCTIEFNEKGEQQAVIDNPLEGMPKGVSSVYRLEGNTIWSFVVWADIPAEPIWAIAIESISEDRLVLIGYVSEDDRQTIEYERIK